MTILLNIPNLSMEDFDISESIKSANESINNNLKNTEEYSMNLSLNTKNVLDASLSAENIKTDLIDNITKGAGLISLAMPKKLNILEGVTSSATSGESTSPSTINAMKEIKGSTFADELGGDLTERLSAFTDKFGESIDVFNKYRNILIQSKISSGEFRDIQKLTGDDLKNVNDVVKALSQTINTFQSESGQVNVMPFVQETMKIPGAINAIIDSNKEGISSLDFMSAAFYSSIGAGQSYKETISDVSNAYKAMQLTGADALQVTAQIRETTDSLQLPLSNARESIQSLINNLGNMTNVGEASNKSFIDGSQIIRDYAIALKEQNMSGIEASSVMNNIVGEIGKMTIAQKAFISQDTGGPGGLMGALQIDKMIEEGDIKGVFNKVQESLKNIMGNDLVTFSQAQESEEDAAQFIKQMEILKSGPLGKFAQNDRQARKLIDVMATGIEATSGEGQLDDLLSDGKELSLKDRNVVTEFAAQAQIQKRDFFVEGGTIINEVATLNPTLDNSVQNKAGQMVNPEAVEILRRRSEILETGDNTERTSIQLMDLTKEFRESVVPLYNIGNNMEILSNNIKSLSSMVGQLAGKKIDVDNVISDIKIPEISKFNLNVGEDQVNKAISSAEKNEEVRKSELTENIIRTDKIEEKTVKLTIDASVKCDHCQSPIKNEHYLASDVSGG